MNRIKLILGGVAGAAGLTSVALVPSFMKSFDNTPTGGKAVSKSWSKDIKKETTFSSFGDAFAPFLLDVDSTDDVFWTQRAEKTISVEFDQSSSVFANLNSFSDIKARVSHIKTSCKYFQSNGFSSIEIGDIERTMQICGYYDSEEERLKFNRNSEGGSPLGLSSTVWTAETICKNLSGAIVNKTCKDIGVDISSSSK